MISLKKTVFPIQKMTALAAILLLSTGCASQTGISATQQSGVPTAAPVNLLSNKTTTTSATAALPSAQATSLAPVMMTRVKRSLNQKNIRRAIRNYRISKGIEAGPYRVMGADLNSNGKGEAIVLFTGEKWCAPTGCTLAVFQQTDRGYRIISVTRRVKAPIFVARSNSYGWRGITVDTGIVDRTLQSVELKFTGARYPGNATLIERIPGRGGDKGELLIGAEANPTPKIEPNTQMSQAVTSAP